MRFMENGHIWRIIEGLLIAGVSGIIVMYGTTAKLQASFDMLCATVSKIELRMEKLGDKLIDHITDRDSHGGR